MSVAVKCDKCGKYFDVRDKDGKKVKRIKITREDISLEPFDCPHYYDLCPECDDEFTKWMEGGK